MLRKILVSSISAVIAFGVLGVGSGAYAATPTISAVTLKTTAVKHIVPINLKPIKVTPKSKFAPTIKLPPKLPHPRVR